MIFAKIYTEMVRNTLYDIHYYSSVALENVFHVNVSKFIFDLKRKSVSLRKYALKPDSE